MKNLFLPVGTGILAAGAAIGLAVCGWYSTRAGNEEDTSSLARDTVSVSVPRPWRRETPRRSSGQYCSAESLDNLLEESGTPEELNLYLGAELDCLKSLSFYPPEEACHNFNLGGDSLSIEVALRQTARAGKLSWVDDDNLASVVRLLRWQKTGVDANYFLLEGFGDRLSESQKDSLLDKLFLEHCQDGYYGFSDDPPPQHMRNLLELHREGRIQFNDDQVARLVRGLIATGNDFDNRYVLNTFGDMLSIEEKDRAAENMDGNGYLSLLSNIPDVTQAGPQLRQARKVRFIVHPVYREFFDKWPSSEVTTLGELETALQNVAVSIHKRIREYDGERVAAMPLVETYLQAELLKGLQGYDGVTVLMLPRAPHQAGGRYPFDDGDAEKINQFARFLHSIHTDDQVFYLETSSTQSGSISRDTLSFLRENLSPLAEVEIAGGYLQRCMFVAMLDLASLGRPMRIDLRHAATSGYHNGALVLRWNGSTNMDQLIRSNRRAIDGYYHDLGDWVQEKMREHPQISIPIRMQY